MIARRGAILLEVVLALGLFIAVSVTLTGVMSTALRSAAANRETLRAASIAASALALIEAGVYTPEAMNGPAPGEALGSADEGPGDGDGPTPFAADAAWWLEIETQRTSYTGLTLVGVSARKGEDGEPGPAMWRLVRLGDDAAFGAGGVDSTGAPGDDGPFAPSRFTSDGPNRFGADRDADGEDGP